MLKSIPITQNSTVSLYTNNKQSANEIKKVPCIKASARIQLLMENLNQGDERHVLWKLKYIKEKMKKTQINKKIYFHAHGFEEIILLKCQYYQKQCTDLMQSLTKFQ